MTGLQLPPRGSLARRFAGATAALAGVAVLLLAVGSWLWIDRLQRDAGLTLQRHDLELRAAQVAEALRRVEERAGELASSPLLTTALTDSLGREAYLLPYLGSIESINTVPVGLMLVDFEGKAIARNNGSPFSAEQRQALLQPLQQGRIAAFVAPDEGAVSLLLTAPIRYPRSRSVEGAVWIKLPLASLLQAEGHLLRVGAPVQPAPQGRLQAAVPLPAGMAPLQLTVERDEQPVSQVQLLGYSGGLLAASVLMVLAVGVLGVRLARRMTADLAALDRFANAAAQEAGHGGRAPLQGTREVAGLAASINRMLDRLQAQHEHLQSEARSQLHLLATCITHLNDVVMITEADPSPAEGHRIVFVNEAFVRMTGYTREEVLGRGPKLLQGPETDTAVLQRLGDALRRWEPCSVELLNYTKGGQRYWVEMSIVPVRDDSGWVTHWVAVERDVTARREAEATRHSLEQQVREAQKMEAIGTLAGGIAHDFNNILGAILGNVALARDDLAQGQPAQERLEQIGRSARRARSLVQQILTYSRRQQQQRVPQDLRALLEEAVALLRATVPARVALAAELPARPVIVMGDATELTQVLINLGTNAWQALHDEAGSVGFGLACEDGWAHVWVRDTGCGMDAQTQARIFEPFFTTKPVGSGTGLGLSVVQGIVRSHGGTIALESAPGQGSTFHLRLPLAPEAPPGRTGPLLANDAGTAPAGHGERVLYLDDDEVMMTVAAAMMQRWGYHVTPMHEAAAALLAVRTDPQAFDLVITDFNMPMLSGIEVLRELRRLAPQLPVILTSGYISDEMRQEALDSGAAGVVRKENLQDELAAQMALALKPSEV
jgi:PAS domain S-box-containing protein